MALEGPVETVFPSVGYDEPNSDRGGGDPDGDAYAATVKTLIADAVNFEESQLAPDRQLQVQYYNGFVPDVDGDDPNVRDLTGDPPVGDENDGKSTFVSMDVRDTIMAILPSLVRIFASSEHVVEFVPTSEEGQDDADQAREYIDYIFWEENDGFLLLHSVFKDALTVRSGIVKWWTDEAPCVRYLQYESISQEQLAMLQGERPDIKVVKQTPSATDPSMFNVSLKFTEVEPRTKIVAVPPEEFRISSNATSMYSARLVGHSRLVDKSELAAMGYSEDDYANFLQSEIPYSEEAYIRNPGLTFAPSVNDLVLYGEYYIRVDQDGDGINELHMICTIGSDHHIVHDEMVDDVKFALFTPDPIPHTVIGDSVAWQVMDIQRIKTNIYRNTLDNLANAVIQRTAVNELQVNMEDALNSEQQPVIRVRGDPGSAVMPISTEFVGDKTFAMLSQLDDARANRTGITEASKGLDPAAMQSTAQVGINAIVSGAQERIELVARILAETGFKHMFKGLLREVVSKQAPQRTLKVRGKWKPFNPSTYDPNMSIRVNPTLGKGSDMNRLAALNDIKQTQLMVIEKFGIQNPVVTPQHFMNTVEDMLSLVNIKNFSRYFAPITPDVQQMIAGQPQQPDPAAVLAQAEVEKVRAETARAVSDKNFDYDKLRMEDDFRRDKLTVDSMVKIATAKQPSGGPDAHDQPAVDAVNHPDGPAPTPQ